ncbi:MAG: glycosyltransferase [Akkermansiaceae bacterium]
MDNQWVKQARDDFDLTNPAHQESVVRIADGLLGEDALRVETEGIPLEARMAFLLADSKKWLQQCRKHVRVSVVFAMWGEHNRLLPKTDENPHGENSLVSKIEQLDWACKDTQIDWHLYAVDDGCPHGSGKIADEIASNHPLGDRVTVLSLADTLPASDGPLKNLENPDGSRKAGAIILGAMRAIQSGADAVVYTDADNSVHLGQLGLLLRPFVDQQTAVVLGNRKHPQSVLVKEGARWGIGIKVLRHMQRMIGYAVFSKGILDTQAAFKLYQSDLLEKIISEPTVYDFSFDTDWILAALSEGVEIAQVPFAFIDSAAESASITQGPMTTWETLLFGLEKQVRRYGFSTGDAAEMSEVLREEISGHKDLEKLINHLPPELEAAGEDDFGNTEVMTPLALRRWIRQRLASA